MYNQMLSVDNFIEIYLSGNAKGINLDKKYFPSLVYTTRALRRLKEIKRKSRNTLSGGQYLLFKKRYNTKIAQLKQHRFDLLKAELEKVILVINGNGFRVTINKKIGKDRKPIYVIDNTAENYFTVKQIQKEMNHLYKIKQSNRDSIINQMKLILMDAIPKYLIRVDVKNFYESIDSTSIISKLNSDNLLSSVAKEVISDLIKQYNQLSNSSIGIPRGIGISAYLAELYMRRFDEQMKSHPDIVFYARYVDDIIAIFVPKLKNAKVDYYNEMKNYIKELKLSFNNKRLKNKFVNLTGSISNMQSISYLGYKFQITMGSDTLLEISPCDKKIEKYKFRISRAINEYASYSNVNEKKARKDLIKRLRFLTGNTMLPGLKNHLMIGCYFSNRHINKYDDLKKLDRFLANKIKSASMPSILEQRALSFSFYQGYLDGKNNSLINTKLKCTDLEDICRIW